MATKAIPELTRTPRLLESLLSTPYTDKFEQPTYVLLQNGLNVEVDLYNAAKGLGQGIPKIVSAAVWIGTNLAAPNVVKHGDFVSLLSYFPLVVDITRTRTALRSESIGKIIVPLSKIRLKNKVS